jgi:hypothetical protein
VKIHIPDFTGHDTAVWQVVANISEEDTGPLSGSVCVWTTQYHAPEQHEICAWTTQNHAPEQDEICVWTTQNHGPEQHEICVWTTQNHVPEQHEICVWTTQNHAPEQREIKLLFLFEMLGVNAWGGSYKVNHLLCLV